MPVQIFPKAVKGDALKIGVAPPPGVTCAHVVPTLISSISVNAVSAGLSCLRKIFPMLAKSPVPDAAVASAVGSPAPIAEVLSQILAASFAVPDSRPQERLF